MDPQELEQLRQKLAELNQSFENFGTNMNKGVTGLGDLTKKLPPAQKAAVEALKGLGNAVTDVTAQLYRGERGAKVAADGIDKMADGIQNALSVLAMFVPGGVLVKGLLLGGGMLVKGLASYGKEASKQADTLFKTYRDLNKIGAAGAGIEEVFTNLQRMGFTVAEIDKFTAVIQKNQKDLLYFGSTVAEGAAGLSAIGGMILNGDLGRGLEMLGLRTEDIANSTATYMTLQGRLGRLQLKTAEELSKESANYVKELDLLARMTGQTRDEQERAQRSLLEDERWTGFLEEAKASGQDLGELQNYLGTLPAELRKGLQHIIAGGGAISSEEARKTIQTIPEAYGIAQDIMNQNISAGQAYSKTMGDIRRFSEQTRGSRRVGATEGFGLTLGGEGGLYDLAQQNETAADRAQRLGISLEEAAKQQQDLALANKNAKANLVDLERSQRNNAQQLDSFINLGIKPATTAAAGFASALNKATSMLPGTPAGRAAARTSADIRSGKGLGTASGYMDKVIQAESGGRNIANQSGPGGTATSSAFGLAQITKGTFEDLARKAGPGNPLFGKTFEDMKGDINLQKQALSQLTDKNRIFLQNAGLSTSDAALYLAHFLGPGGAKRVLSQPDNAPIQGAVDFQQFMANPNLQRMSTVGDLKAWADQKMGGGGYRYGGIASGPNTGYSTVLHGTEAVVPLPDGKTIPVSFNMDEMINRLERAIRLPAGTGAGSDSVSLMTQQISRLDELINQMRNQVNISQKILQYSR